MITVMGATGNVGSVVVRQLLSTGEEVRALGRSRERLAPLEAAGAIPVVGHAADPAYLANAFHGADAVQVLMPFDPVAQDYLAGQQRTGQAIVAALRASGVPHVVALSSIGAALGLPDLAYVRLPDADMIGVLREAGVAEPQASLLVGLSRGLSEGVVASREERSALNTLPTRFEDYAAELASATQEV